MFQIVSKPDQIIYMGLSTEANPPVTLDQSIYLQINTGKVYKVVQGAWHQILANGTISPVAG